MPNKPSIRRKAAVRESGELHFHFPFGRTVFFLIMVLSVGAGSGGCIRRPAEPVLERYDSKEQDAAEEALSDRAPESGTGGEASSGRAPGSETGEEALADRATDSATAGERFPAQDPQQGTAEEPVQTVTVHVCGAVKKEGVYTLPAGSRIEDAVRAAGGFSKEADTTWLNLARRLEDAVQIRVPSREEAETMRGGQVRDSAFGSGTGPSTGAGNVPAGVEDPEEGSASAGEKININTASREELMKIPGIGETKAQRILEYREAAGGFESIEDLMKVPGIKKASFEKMRAYITT